MSAGRFVYPYARHQSHPQPVSSTHRSVALRYKRPWLTSFMSLSVASLRTTGRYCHVEKPRDSAAPDGIFSHDGKTLTFASLSGNAQQPQAPFGGSVRTASYRGNTHTHTHALRYQSERFPVSFTTLLATSMGCMGSKQSRT